MPETLQNSNAALSDIERHFISIGAVLWHIFLSLLQKLSQNVLFKLITCFLVVKKLFSAYILAKSSFIFLLFLLFIFWLWLHRFAFSYFIIFQCSKPFTDNSFLCGIIVISYSICIGIHRKDCNAPVQLNCQYINLF